MAKEEKPKEPMNFRADLILLINSAKQRGIALDEIQSALHCEIDFVTAEILNSKPKKKKV